MNRVKIYEIKSGASVNAQGLLSSDDKCFFWDDAQFTNNSIGDKVFVINPTHKWALFTEIKAMDIDAHFIQAENKSRFSFDNKSYSVEDPDGRFKTFIRFDIVQKVQIPDDWKWTTILGSSQIYDLWRDDRTLDSIEKRLEKADDLQKLFPAGDAYVTLGKTRDLLKGGVSLNSVIVEAIRSESIQLALVEKDFHFTKAQTSLQNLDSFTEPTPGFFQDTFDSFDNSGKTYKEFISELNSDSDEYRLLTSIGKLISYCDVHAADKNQLNEYEDKRTLAKSFVRQTDWVKSLLNYKVNNNNKEVLPPSVKNALEYLVNPMSELTMLSENHRIMVSKYLLKQKKYEKSSLVQDVINYFLPYNIQPKNELNLTRIISNILYRFPNVKELWFERVEGLVVCDNTGWIEEAIGDFEGSNFIALWWDKSPTGGNKVIKLLQEAITDSEEHCFYIYYTINQVAQYRSRIVDFVFESDYSKKDWNKNNDVAWYFSNFSDYKGKNKNGSDKFAKVVFLADKIEKLKEPVSMEHFEFYNGYSAPTQNNMQPYTAIDLESEIEIDHYPKRKSTNTMNPKEIITHVRKYMGSMGFQYHYEEIANFFLALKAKPFVILAGISGTGKTQLPRKFAEAIGMVKDEQVIQVPVRPDWTDGSDLLGYIGLDNEFKAKDLTLAIQKANRNNEKPYFFILDEMNLARVEHYFSDFLSVIETRKWLNGKRSGIATDPILRTEVLQNAKNKNDFNELHWPKNLYLVGTVNMDETTHSFSRKVLDRANSIEMNDVDLNWISSQSGNIEPLENIDNSIFETEFLGSIDLTDDDKNSIQSDMDLLREVNDILRKADLHFAYRVRDEVAFYLLLNKKFDLMDKAVAMDFQLVQKVLPRIHGSSERVQIVLVSLLNLLEGTNFRTENFEFSQLKDKINEGELKYKRASKKILFMLKRFDDDRFTSFWI